MARTTKVVEDRREQILEAALRVFAQKGFARATNQDIARAAGITPGLIYHYFASKEALFRAIIESRSPARLLQALPPPCSEQPPEERLRFLVKQLLAMAEEESFVQIIRLFLPEIIHNPAVVPAGLVGVGFAELAHFIEQSLAEQMARGELRPVDAALTAQVLLSSITGMALRRQVLRDPLALRYNRDEMVDGIVTTTLRGLLPPA